MLTCRRLLGSDLLSAVCLNARQLHAAVAGRMPASGLHEQSAAGDRHQEAASTPSQPAESSSSGATATIDPGTPPQPRFVVPIRKKKEPVPLLLGLERVQEFSRLKKRAFPESVEASIKLGIDPKRTDQIVKGSVVLPHGTGKRVVIAVFADGQDAVTAREAGADIVGGAELVEKVKADKGLAADKVLATPGMLKQVSSVARILGPKGLMPNPKMGTVTNNVAATIEMMRHGQLQFRSDRRACINIAFGKVEFEKKHLEENLLHFLSNLVKLRPKGVKGSGMSGFVSQVVLSTTMGPGVPIELSSLSNPVQRQRTRTAQ